MGVKTKKEREGDEESKKEGETVGEGRWKEGEERKERKRTV